MLNQKVQLVSQGESPEIFRESEHVLEFQFGVVFLDMMLHDEPALFSRSCAFYRTARCVKKASHMVFPFRIASVYRLPTDK